MNGTGIFFALFPAANKKLKEQDYWGISPSITLKTVKIYLSRDTQAGISQSLVSPAPLLTTQVLSSDKKLGWKIEAWEIEWPTQFRTDTKNRIYG